MPLSRIRQVSGIYHHAHGPLMFDSRDSSPLLHPFGSRHVSRSLSASHRKYYRHGRGPALKEQESMATGCREPPAMQVVGSCRTSLFHDCQAAPEVKSGGGGLHHLAEDIMNLGARAS